MARKEIKIELTEKEDAQIYAEKTLGRNKTIQKRAKVIYYASKGAESIKELGEITGINRFYVSQTLNGYKEKGIGYIYECSRGKKQSILDTIESELLEDFAKNPPSSIPEAVSRISKDYGIRIIDTPVRYWLKKRSFVILSQDRFRQKQT